LASLAEDINVDELRRRARRRLVGAIVLALAAAVIVPMLLESEPRPLGEDVAVKIPPVDEGKFVNRLNDPAAKADKAGAPPADTKASSPPPKVADATPPKTAEMSPPEPKAPAAEQKAAPPPSAAPASPAPPPAATAPTAVTPAPAPAAVHVPSTPPAAAAAPATSAPPANGTFAVQLAAFSDDKGANALAGKLKRAGYSAYTEPFKTSKGTLWRVRVGPYPTRDAANAARDKLKSEGQSGIVAPSH
jgi:DedD protein